MIVTVTLNPALDLTYTVDALVPQATNRVRTVAERPGGKGLNVASVLHALGEPVLATGLLGGPTGAHIEALVRFPAAFVPIAGDSRRTVTIVDATDATGLWEPGPTVTGAEWAAFLDHFAVLLPEADAVVLSGSLPQGLPPDAYAVLVRAARAQGVPTILDTSGEPLRHGVGAAPDIVKPNEHELAALGQHPTDAIAAGVRAVVVSLGHRGLHAHTADGTWRMPPPAVVTGNPTGAGDACVAALARGLRNGVGQDDRTPSALNNGAGQDDRTRAALNNDRAGEDNDRDGADNHHVGERSRHVGEHSRHVGEDYRHVGEDNRRDGPREHNPAEDRPGNRRGGTTWPAVLADAAALAAAAVVAPVAGEIDLTQYQTFRRTMQGVQADVQPHR
ncbi:1-phosphofructokinase family hexose kinase [Dactylosporangium sp. AC04546]|uniref:1-phosphofructokinase family hexose kinase n=1 Tax=Dactylosporangium sp. AC04546 TaxID=2862460 RepID=UPI001EDD6B32|nr:1-phosphofructokinase family hexose kinase [Dactylosporangium sp. AC04546]WVK83396.1 1-phosphofructokinase family hexose kinase [Dactylosporangium sp. AC04546]